MSNEATPQPETYGLGAAKVDQFESVFRAAAKESLSFDAPRVERVLIVTDLDRTAADAYGARVRALLEVLTHHGADSAWQILARDDYASGQELLDRITHDRVDLVCSYRHLREKAYWPHGLGTYVDVLTQAAPCPVLVTPHPDAAGVSEHAMVDTDTVMAMTDHLSGDHRLVNWAALFTQVGGELWLAHVEDSGTFDRFAGAISRIEGIETERATTAIRDRLLEDPADFVASCETVLGEHYPEIQVRSSITFGHRLYEYRRLIEEHRIDLLVIHTKDDDQMAMHGLAYPLAVELRGIPLLML